VNQRVRVELVPLGVSLEVERGTALRPLLANHGVEFACDGESLCGACRVRLIEGTLAIASQDREILTRAELAAGWRLGCRARAESPLKLRCEAWSMAVLADDAQLSAGKREGLAVAVDLGTTTIAAQLLDLKTGKLLGVRTGLNPQTAHGGDIMSRVRFALKSGELTPVIRSFIGAMIHDLAGGREDEIVEVLLVGNTVMHHLFAGCDISPLSHVPFASANLKEQGFTASELDWKLAGSARVRFLPCIGGFVGSDILAGIVAVGLNTGDKLRALIDLGTNGEIALGNKERILSASTAAGTAFEAGSIKMGMRAATGAISRVFVHQGTLQCKVIGEGEPRGICGSGLVDAVAAGLETGAIMPNGRLAQGAKEFSLSGAVKLWQSDVRELQLAKAAIASGLRILLDHSRASMDDIETVYLAGAFGNYVRAASAVRIGLLEMPIDRVIAAGNTALRGGKLLLGRERFPELDVIQHVSLAADPDFQDRFVECLGFPTIEADGAAASTLENTAPSR
jgi:uncharacterized 2Fe-2S/4Fe-4S cluster protein (DUF4445 family)